MSQQQHVNPVWSECYTGAWDIRVYQRASEFEACFIHCDLWHEHVKAESLDAVLALARRTIEQRIAEDH